MVGIRNPKLFELLISWVSGLLRLNWAQLVNGLTDNIDNAPQPQNWLSQSGFCRLKTAVWDPWICRIITNTPKIVEHLYVGYMP